MIANRVAMGNRLAELGKADEKIVIVESDIAGSVNFGPFIEAFPERHFDCGIAEQNMVGVAAGLASCGYIPFVASFAVFASMRALDQVRNALCYNNFKVVVIGSHAGLETGPDGATHQAIEDVAIMRAVPNIKVLVPSTPNMTMALTTASAYCDGPVYLRLGRDKVPEFYDEKEAFPIGGSKTLREGTDVTLIANGTMVSVSLQAAEELEKKGISARVIDMYSIKPLDTAAILKAAQETRGIVTVEDHNIIGGLGGAVCETVAEAGLPCQVHRIGVQDKLGKSGKSSDLFEMYGLTSGHVVSAAEKLLAK